MTIDQVVSFLQWILPRVTGILCVIVLIRVLGGLTPRG